jgi:PAS domain S-box-containing protein
MILDKKRSVLVVEDERIVAVDLQRTLVSLGYDAYAIASSADEAIARASERCPDIVLMDIRIKGRRDGIETAAILKRRFGVPVLYLSAHADEGTLDRAKATEPYGYLMKPIKGPELRNAIEVALYRSETERALRVRERGFATALRSVTDAIVTVDLGGRITFMNPAAEALTGISAEEGVGRFARDVLWSLEQPDDKGDEPAVAVALREGRAVDLDPRPLPSENGNERWIDDSAIPVIEEGQTLGGVMVFRDVSERERLQRQLEFADRLASLGTMAAGVAHEINNPLAVVVGNTGFVTETLMSHTAEHGLEEASKRRFETMLQALADIQSAAERMERIVADLRKFSRPGHRQAGLVDVTQCAAWAVRSTSKQLRERARIVTRFGETHPVQADETRLGQVFVNLLVNAAQSIPPGHAADNEIAVTTRLDERGWVETVVSDTGSGIPEDVLAHVFEPFFTTKPADVGTGLGLSISHGIVTSLGGELRAESEVGKGTRFIVALRPASQDEIERMSVTRQRTGPRRGRLLVVDQDPLASRTIARMLDEHDVIVVENVAEVTPMLERGAPFDLLLVDVTASSPVTLPFYESLLARDPDLAARVIFLSEPTPSRAVAALLDATVNLRLNKPFTQPALLETVQRGLASPASQGRMSVS